MLRGAARFVDDIHMPSMTHAAFLRSPVAHGRVRRLDLDHARRTPGVVAAFGPAELAPLLAYPRLQTALPSAAYRQSRDRPVLAGEETCHVGEPLALVVGESRYAAEDGAAAIGLDLETLPAAADCRDALAPDAAPVHSGAADNLLAAYEIGYGDVDAAFAAAAHRIPVSLRQHKGLGLAIECRGAVAAPDPSTDMLSVWLSSQAPHGALRVLVEMLGREEDRIAVRAPDIGGGFGPKLVVYPEDVAVAAAALALGRPVKWIEDRREHFVATTQERDQYWDLEAAADAEGRLLGLRGRLIHDHGAYTARGLNLSHNAASVVPGPYHLPAYRLEVRVALTNKVPTSPVRGAGHPQGTFAMERVLDRIADRLGLAPEETRRRNLIALADMPYERALTARSGAPVVLDSGDYPACQAAAVDLADYPRFRARQRAARAAGRHLGIGLANYVKGTGRGPFEAVTLRIVPSGKVSLYTGATAIGQGTRTMLAQIAAEPLGMAPADLRVIAGDSTVSATGIGASASRQAVNAGSSARLAAEALADRVRRLAAGRLETAPEDIELAAGRARVRGAAALSVGFGELANAVYGTPGYALPQGARPGLEESAAPVFDALTYANGCHACEVEVDAETGRIAVLRYIVVHDCGRMVNPMIVDGQIAGGVVHGLGNALLERMVFDSDAQPLTATLADYAAAGATTVPRIAIRHIESPSDHNPLGIKGVGESGTVPAAAAVAAAVEDALRPYGIQVSEVPIDTAALASKIAAARAAKGAGPAARRRRHPQDVAYRRFSPTRSYYEYNRNMNLKSGT